MTSSLPIQNFSSREPPKAAYNFLSNWEKNTHLSQLELSCIEKLSEDSQKPTKSDSSIEKSAISPSDPMSSIPMGSLTSFSTWFEQHESTYVSDRDRKYIENVGLLDSQIDACSDVLEQVDEALSILRDLESQHRDVSRNIGELHRECGQLSREKENLSSFASTIRSYLSYFDDLELLTIELSSTKLDVTSDSFATVMRRLDDCIAFLRQHPDFLETKPYLAKFRQLQSRGLAALRDHIVAALRTTGASILEAVKQSEKSEATETSLLYVKFRASLADLRLLIQQVEERALQKECSVFIGDCHQCYFQQRASLLFPSINAAVQRLVATKDIALLVRSGCSYMIRVCVQEYQLFHHFFISTPSQNGLRAFLESVSSSLYEALRSMVIAQNDIDTLCDLVEILRNEILVEGVKPKGEPAQCFEGVVHRMVQDVQERLIYRAAIFIRDEIRGHKATADDLSYPAKLIEARKEAQLLEHQRSLSSRMSEASSSFGRSISGSATPTRQISARSTPVPTPIRSFHRREGSTASQHSADSPVSLRLNMDPAADRPQDLPASALHFDQAQGTPSAAVDIQLSGQPGLESEAGHTGTEGQQPDVESEPQTPLSPPVRRAFWTSFPTLEKTLLFLSKIYRCVETGVFEGLAQEAVSVCTQSFLDASKLVGEQKSTLDAQLFLVKHLLTLREQISPFEVDFSITEKTLDFTHLRESLNWVLSGRMSIAPHLLKVNSLIASIVNQTRPRITENHHDSKRDIERELRMVCENFIVDATNAVAEPLLTVLSKISIHRREVLQQSGGQPLSATAALALNVPQPVNDQPPSASTPPATPQPPISSRSSVSSHGSSKPSFFPAAVNTRATGGSAQVEAPSKSLTFAELPTAEEVQSACDFTLKSIPEHMPTLVDKMSLYLQNPITESILLKPVKANIIEAIGQLHSYINLDLDAHNRAKLNVPPVEHIVDMLDSFPR